MRALVAKANEFHAGVCVQIDEVAIRRAVGCAREDPDAAIVVFADAIHLLFENRIDTVVAREVRREATARGIGQRVARRTQPLIGKGTEMPPGADFEFAIQTWVALLPVSQKLHFPQRKRRIVDPEVDAIAVTKLRIV
jgi:hypothetical protein